MLAPSPRRALPQCRLVAPAAQLIHPDATRPGPKVRGPRGAEGTATAQLLADHVCVLQVPAVVTHCAPRASVKHLHAPRTAAGPGRQPYPMAPCRGTESGRPTPHPKADGDGCGPSLTRAHDAHVLRGPRGHQQGFGHVALGQEGLSAQTARLAQPHPDGPTPGRRRIIGSLGPSASQLPAHDACAM